MCLFNIPWKYSIVSFVNKSNMCPFFLLSAHETLIFLHKYTLSLANIQCSLSTVFPSLPCFTWPLRVTVQTLFGEMGKSQFCGDFVGIEGNRCKESLWAGVLRSWGYGKSDKRATIAFICRQGQYRNDACQQTEVMVFIGSLCVINRVTANSVVCNGICKGSV